MCEPDWPRTKAATNSVFKCASKERKSSAQTKNLSPILDSVILSLLCVCVCENGCVCVCTCMHAHMSVNVGGGLSVRLR